MQHYDVIIVGAGAAGLMCAIEAGKRGRHVLLVDHASSVGKKIRISGGGRCNFTNLHASPANYLSQNPHFCVSALTRYTQHDFIALVEKHKIAYHEKTLGQLFCNGSAQEIIDMLVEECRQAQVTIALNTGIQTIAKQKNEFIITTNKANTLTAASLVIATGGPSIPKMGATGWGYEVAKQFNINIIPPRAALVPFTLKNEMHEQLKNLSGISVEAEVTCGSTSFREGMLFTHRGLSGPAILQISSYWQANMPVIINLAPNIEIYEHLKALRSKYPKQDIQNALQSLLPKRLAAYLCDCYQYRGQLANMSNNIIASIAHTINGWQIYPDGTEGYRTAEVTLGGVDTNALSSKTCETKQVPGLYFIGEVVDVTGHLGGFNFQWAWSSGYVAGQYV